MLETALKARLPLIVVRTRDLIHVRAVVQHMVPGAEVVSAPKRLSDAEGKWVLITPDSEVTEPESMYQKAIDSDVSVLLVNPEHVPTCAFDAGELQLPTLMLVDFLRATPCKADPMVVRACAGLTLKEVGELCRLTMYEYEDLSAEHVNDCRRRFFPGVRGVEHVSTDYPYYVEDSAVAARVEVDKEIFLREDIHPMLVPRGVLLDGPPGVGKTMAAKYVARALTLPLYRLDVGALMGRYVGDSEGHTAAALAYVDNVAPAVLLIDEVEKLFRGEDDSGVSQRILAALLWWLQEHRSRVYTVMTTNDKNALPTELYRRGRIDAEIPVGMLARSQAWKFAYEFMVNIGHEELAKKFKPEYLPYSVNPFIAHADAVQSAVDFIKRQIAGGSNE